MNKSSPDEIRSVVDIVVRLTGQAPETIERVPTNEDNRVFRITTGSQTLYFKSESASGVSVASWTYDRARRAGVPVPEVLEVDLSAAKWPEPYMVMVASPGVQAATISAPEARSRVAREAGRIHRLLHSVVLDGFGYIDPDTGRGRYEDHETLVRGFAQWGMSFIRESGMIGLRELDRIQQVVDRHPELAPPPARGVLIHGDPGLEHVFCDPSTLSVTGVIDFEPKAADPAIDLAVFAYHHPDLVESFLEGYGPVMHDLDVRMDLYRLTRGLGVARWNSERGFDHQEDVELVSKLSGRLHALLR